MTNRTSKKPRDAAQPQPYLPDGKYLVLVYAVRAWQSAEGERWIVQAAVQDGGGEFENRLVFEIIAPGAVQARRLLWALQLPSVQVEPSDLVGRRALVRLHNGEVADWTAAPSGPQGGQR